MIPPFVDPGWLEGRDVVLADVRWYLDGRSGRDAFEAGHLPGAVWIDLDRWLAAPGSPERGRHPLPEPGTFARGMGEAGIGDDATVVAYDDLGGVVAARLVWMLRALGTDAALLDGGMHGELERGPSRPRPASFTPRPWPAERLAGIDDLHAPGRVLLDARAPERFRGEVEPVDPRPGRIPGARNAPAGSMLAPDGRLLGHELLRERLGDVGSDVVASCGSGVNACHTLLVLEALGVHGRLYPGSYSQWSHTDREVETG